jgi:hypothetical protein
MFDIITHRDSHAKLKADFDDFANEEDSARLALNCAITAYHLHEWVWGDWLKTDTLCGGNSASATRNLSLPARESVDALLRAFHELRNVIGDFRSEIAQFDFRQAQEFDDRQHAHSFLHCGGRDNRSLLEAPLAPEEAGAPLAAGTKWTSAWRLRP